MLNVSLVSLMIYELVELSTFKKSFLASLISVGFLAGCSSGYLGDKLGRVCVFRKLLLFDMTGIIGVVLSPSYWVLAVSCLVLGVGAGGDEVLANTIALESFPPTKRAKITLLSVAWSFGLVLGYGISLILALVDFELVARWRAVACVSLVLTLLSVFLRLTLKETPVFLYRKKRFDEYLEDPKIKALRAKMYA